MTPKAEEKKEGDYTLTVPLDREKTKTATFYLRDIDETVFLATKALLDKGKELDAVLVMIKALRVGGDDPKVLENNFIAKQSASFLLGQFLEPVQGELKKN
jgi:hypothetical protein